MHRHSFLAVFGGAILMHGSDTGNHWWSIYVITGELGNHVQVYGNLLTSPNVPWRSWTLQDICNAYPTLLSLTLADAAVAEYGPVGNFPSCVLFHNGHLALPVRLP